MVEYVFLLAGLIFVLLIVSYWQKMGLSLAEERFGELKVHTSTQIKNVILLMQQAPVESETCVQMTGCTKIAIHKNYVELWGQEKEYFKEPAYLSEALSTGMLDIYAKDEFGNLKPLVDCNDEGMPEVLSKCSADTTEYGPLDCGGFVTTCGFKNSIFFICLKKQYIEVGAGNGNLVESSKGSGFFEKTEECLGTHKLGIVITKQTDISR